MVLVGRLMVPVTKFTDKRDFVEFPFCLHDEGLHPSVTSVMGPRETRLCFFGGHVPDDGTTKCSDNCTLFTALKEGAKKDAHPFPGLDAFPVSEACFLVHDLNVESANLLTKTHKEVCLLSKVLVLRTHLVELLVRRIGFGHERSSAAVHLVECFLSCTDSFQTFPDVRDVGSERCE